MNNAVPHGRIVRRRVIGNRWSVLIYKTSGQRSRKRGRQGKRDFGELHGWLVKTADDQPPFDRDVNSSTAKFKLHNTFARKSGVDDNYSFSNR